MFNSTTGKMATNTSVFPTLAGGDASRDGSSMI